MLEGRVKAVAPCQSRAADSRCMRTRPDASAGRGAPKGDLDFQTPLPRAEQFLSKAAAMEPQHYFTYLFLSAVLRAEYRHHEAELVANTCVGLRPDYAVGYEGRAVALADQAIRATDSEL